MYRFNTKIRLTMLCLSGFELYSRWVPLIIVCNFGGRSISGSEVIEGGLQGHPSRRKQNKARSEQGKVMFERSPVPWVHEEIKVAKR